jgi:PEGA domain
MFRLVQGRDLVEVKLVFSCADEAPPCMTQAAQSIGANKLVFGSVQPVGTDAFIVTIKLLDAERGVVESWVSEQINKAQATPVGLRAPVQKWFATLTGQALPGTLKIAGGVVGAAVLIDGVQAGLLGSDGLMVAGVAGGQHQLTVSKTGYEKWERNVTLSSGATERIQVQLKSIENPSELAQAEPIPPPVGPVGSTPGPAREPPNQGSRVGAWALLGLGIVGVGLGGYSSYRVTSINSSLDQYRRYECSGSAFGCHTDGKPFTSQQTTDERNYIDSQKSSGDNWSKVQWVGYGVGGALIVTSAVLFYHGYFGKPDDTASSGTSSRLVLLPSIGRSNVGALAFVAF